MTDNEEGEEERTNQGFREEMVKGEGGKAKELVVNIVVLGEGELKDAIDDARGSEGQEKEEKESSEVGRVGIGCAFCFGEYSVEVWGL
ncbi:unnamed protein product [Ilex paraguariensis]|uniref:Uncharacterized protein n=1 Tax=Ilex paraguariensis TaxID=185542 RepID=A0ABC8RI57_9AQUA